jgi:hypothetical protein
MKDIASIFRVEALAKYVGDIFLRKVSELHGVTTHKIIRFIKFLFLKDVSGMAPLGIIISVNTLSHGRANGN